MRISDLPESSRPKEKALSKGIEVLSDAELIALFINSGYKNFSALDIANSLLKKYDNLANLTQLKLEHLIEEKGISETKALRLVALFEVVKRVVKNDFQKGKKSEWDVKLFYKQHRFDFLNLETERLVLYILNDYYQVVRSFVLYEGNEGGFEISYKQIFYHAIILNAKKIVLVHNHPSQIAEPSFNDFQFHIALKKECEKMKIILVDNLIFTNNDFVSLTKTQ